MIANSQKLAIYNQLAESVAWHELPAGITMPPALSKSAGTVIEPYLDIVSDADNLALLKDGDQNLPCFFAAGECQLILDFGVPIAPAIIGCCNHDCFETDDEINIYRSTDGLAWTLAANLAAPSRAVDLCYPLRGNDAWCNIAGLSYRWWKVELVKDSGGAYLGELFVALNYYSLVEPSPQPAWSQKGEFQRRLVRPELACGEFLEYETAAPRLLLDLPIPPRVVAEAEAEGLRQHLIHSAASLCRRSPTRQLLVWQDDRVCLFGRLSESGSLSLFPDSSFSAGPAFAGDWPEGFPGDAWIST